MLILWSQELRAKKGIICARLNKQFIDGVGWVQVGGGWAQKQASPTRRTSKLLLSQDWVTCDLFSPPANSVTCWTTNIPRQECESFPAQTQQAGKADVCTLLFPTCPLCLFWDVRMQWTHSGPELQQPGTLHTCLWFINGANEAIWKLTVAFLWQLMGVWQGYSDILMRFKPIDFNYLVKSLHLLPFSPTLSRRSRQEVGLKPKSLESQASNSAEYSLQMLLDPDPSYVL